MHLKTTLDSSYQSNKYDLYNEACICSYAESNAASNVTFDAVFNTAYREKVFTLNIEPRGTNLSVQLDKTHERSEVD